jgi:hypothetical protein
LARALHAESAKEAAMSRNRMIIAVLVIMAIAVATPIVLNRYYLTPLIEQSVPESAPSP